MPRPRAAPPAGTDAGGAPRHHLLHRGSIDATLADVPWQQSRLIRMLDEFVETYLKSPQRFEAGETLLWHEPANLMRGFRGVGGHRYLTDRRLLFAPNRVERWIRSRPWSCPLDAVDDIGTAEARTVFGRKLLVSAGGDGTLRRPRPGDRQRSAARAP